jgi:UDPglucose 6-dehydrogenase
MKVAIVGYGMAGKATKLLMDGLYVTETVVSDPPQGLMLSADDWVDVGYAMICVPTPGGEDGKLDVTIVHQAIRDLPPHVVPVIRSTIGPDQCAEFVGAIFWPEFIRENHIEEDVGSMDVCSMLGQYEGGPNPGKLLRRLRAKGYDTWLTSPEECMFVKTMINTFLAMKVGFANDMWLAAKAQGLLPSTIFQLAMNDVRLGTSHWEVPGPDGKFGFGGSCLPKDSRHMGTLLPKSNLQNSIQDYDHSKQRL